MQQLASGMTPGWLGARLDASAADLPTGVDAVPGEPMTVRVGNASLAGNAFAVVTPFIGAGHLTIDRDAHSTDVAGWLRGLLLRAVAALPDGSLRVAPVDGATLGAGFAPFRALVETEAWRRPAIDLLGLNEVLSEAEERIERRQAAERDPTVLVIACAPLPAGSGRGERSRLAAIGHAGPSAGVYLLLAGYPSAQHPGLDAAPHLERATRLTSRTDGLFTVSDAPGPRRFSSTGGLPVGARLDRGPSDDLIESVCRRLAKTVKAQAVTDFAGLTAPWKATSPPAPGARTSVAPASPTTTCYPWHCTYAARS
jgi:hypothetical protein